MTSRELRRAGARQAQPKQNDNDKRRRSHPVTYIFSLAILIIIVVTFIGLPYYQSIARSGTLIFGSYNGTEIKFVQGNYFSDQKDLIAQKLQNSNQNLSPEAEAYQVWRGAFEQTAIHIAIMQAAQDAGVQVTSGQVDNALAQYGPYVVNGKFSIDQYNQTSTQDRARTRALFQEELIDQQYRDDVINGEKYSTQAVSFLQGMASPERKFRYVSYSLSSYPSSQVVDYGKANSRLFRTINVSRITIKSSANDANTIWKKLEQNPDLFEQIAKNQSRDAFADKGGEMGTLTYSALKPDFENQAELDKLFAMKKGEITGVIKASFGWTIYRVNQAAKEPDLTDPLTIKTIRTYMEQYERGTIEDYFVAIGNKFHDAAQSNGFAGAAAAGGLAVHETNYFPINYGDSFFLPQIQTTDNDPSLSSVSYKSDFLQEAFTLPIGGVSKPIILDNYVVVISPEDQRSAPEQYQKVLSSYYPLIVQQFTQADLTDEIMSSKKLVDNFQQVFFKNFNFQNSPQQQAQ
ncbi:MAG TPA: peptidylprolyl isomerase [Spirochaetia bacterium]|nr:peptidylprolyl isomerase [Spirochaetia bacterium]